MKKYITEENNFLYLFLALVGLLLFSALTSLIHKPFIKISLDFFLIGVFLVSLLSTKFNDSWKRSVYLFSFLLLSLTLVQHILFSSVIQYLILLVLFLFFIGSFMQSFWQIINAKRLDLNMIIGSIVLYLLLGLIFTIIYLGLLGILPDSLDGVSGSSWRENFTSVTYFSFVTLSTLGYGDIIPGNALSKFFAYSESIAGVFYMAIIVASIVSLRLKESKDVH